MAGFFWWLKTRSENTLLAPGGIRRITKWDGERYVFGYRKPKWPLRCYCFDLDQYVILRLADRYIHKHRCLDLGVINWIRTLAYQSDRETHGTPENWPRTVDEVMDFAEGRRPGDCDDHAVLAISALAAIGENKFRLAVGYHGGGKRRRINHAYILRENEEKQWDPFIVELSLSDEAFLPYLGYAGHEESNASHTHTLLSYNPITKKYWDHGLINA